MIETVSQSGIFAVSALMVLFAALTVVLSVSLFVMDSETRREKLLRAVIGVLLLPLAGSLMFAGVHTAVNEGSVYRHNVVGVISDYSESAYLDSGSVYVRLEDDESKLIYTISNPDALGVSVDSGLRGSHVSMSCRDYKFDQNPNMECSVGSLVERIVKENQEGVYSLVE